MNQIIKFVEKNVDGCGTDVEEMVLFKTDTLLTNGHKERLIKTLEDIKKERRDEDWDTGSLIEEAFHKVFGEEVEMQFILPDIYVEF